MINAIMIFNNEGKPRLTKFYAQIPTDIQQLLIAEIFALVSDRPSQACNFLEGSTLVGGEDVRVIYRHYATLYFVFVVDEAESELGILDLIQVFVEALDKCFENVCELDLIFHFDEIYAILGEVVCGGLVVETNVSTIVASINETKRMTQRRGVMRGS